MIAVLVRVGLLQTFSSAFESLMKCPHCLENFHDRERHTQVGQDADGIWSLSVRKCSSCNRWVLHLTQSKGWISNSGGKPQQIVSEVLVRPRGSARPPCPTEVPSQIAEDYREACIVLPDSAKASAALSRRCLQNILREAAKVKHGNLHSEIQELIDSGCLPTHLVESIDAVRNIGNFSAHPMKSQHTGDILPVEPHEADWNLDVIEALFDFFYVQPALLKKKRLALDQKLAEAGKPPMK